jgi:polyhydroxyalkanoate synthesis regulator phasin
MKPLIKVLLLVPFTILAAVPAYAGHGTGRLEGRLERQQERIDAGVDSGALTHKETRVLKREQKKLRKMMRRIGEDGRITKKESRRLTAKLDKASHRIREFKHNSNYRVVHTERCFDSRRNWRNGRHHRWSYELTAGPRLSHR